jgi:hypothetical protein
VKYSPNHEIVDFTTFCIVRKICGLKVIDCGHRSGGLSKFWID